ncbi:MAG: type II secretion system minor pseudopilin GspH [Pseudomonadota bacterium]
MKLVQANSGFTLFEIVIVVAIFAIMITMATISMGDPQAKRMKQNSERVATLIQLAKEQAIFNSQDYALSFWESGYAFHTLTENGWAPIDNDRIFRTRNLPDGLQFNLYLEGIKVILKNKDSNKPQIFITSDGEISPFKLEITDRYDLLYEISFNETGDFEISLADA